MADRMINPEIFGELITTMGADYISEVVDAYLEDTPLLIESLHEALNTGDLEIFRRSAHSLKSTSASFGAVRLAETARRLEHQASAGSLEGADAALAELDELYNLTRLELLELKNA